jgi:TPR repeat protein
MKKFLGILVLSLLLCNVGVADTLPTYEFSEFERNYLEKNFYNIDPENRFYPNDYPNAMISLGWKYFKGIDGFEKNNEKANLWNNRASNLGWAIASSNLGLFYYAGVAGVEQNLSKAHHYYLLAANQWDNSITEETGFYFPEEIIKEMNLYNPTPTKQFAKLRDLYFVAIKYKTKKKTDFLIQVEINKLKNFLK